MKLNITGFLLLFCIIINSASAQKSDFRFGLKAMPQLEWLKPDTKGVSSDGTKLAFSWGFLAEYYFADNYAVATGVELAARGGKIRILDTLKSDVRLKYIDLPITIKMRTNEIGYMRYFGQFGFTPGINISAKSDSKGNTFTKDDEDIKSDIVPVNVGLLIALGMEYTLGGNTALVVSASFNNGFIDIYKSSYTDGNGNKVNIKMMSNYVALNVGVLF